MKINYAVLLVLITTISWAQKRDLTDIETYRSKYPDEQAIFLSYEEHIDIRIEGDSLNINTRTRREMLHMGTQSNVFAKDNVHSSTFYYTKRIEAKTLVPGKKKYEEVLVSDFKESFDKNSSVFYDDSKTTSFFYPAIQPGAVTSLEYDQRITEPRFLSGYVFQSYLPVESSKFTITADKGVELMLDVLNDNGSIITRRDEKDGRVTYSYEMRNAAKLKFEEKAPPLRYTAPHVVAIIKNYTTANGTKVPVLTDAGDLFGWYSSFIADLKDSEYENIKEVVSSIIKPADSELEKVRKIFYWVQGNIKYVAFEDGMRGLIPHNAGYVCDKRYGDCKDMASILVNMLHAAGIEAYFTWIGTRDIPYKYSTHASPIVDNHMIASYQHNGKYYFLDATSQYSSFELPSSMIQGKEALVAKAAGDFEIVEVPVIDNNANLRRDSAVAYLDNGVVRGTGTLELNGYPKVVNSFRMIKSSKSGVDKYMTQLLERGSNKFFVDQYDIKNIDNLDKPIVVNYEYRIEDYYREAGNKILVNLNLDKALQNDIIEDDREQPIEYDFKFRQQYITTLNIPDGYTVKRTPANDTHTTDIGGFEISYTTTDNTVVMKKEVWLDTLMIMPDDFDSWNNMIKDLNAAYRNILILEKK